MGDSTRSFSDRCPKCHKPFGTYRWRIGLASWCDDCSDRYQEAVTALRDQSDGWHPPIVPVAQRAERDCGIACIAMLTGLPYEAVADDPMVVRCMSDDGLSTQDVVRLLGHFGIAVRQEWGGRNLGGVRLVLYRAHYAVAMSDNRLLDPNRIRHGLPEWTLDDWIPEGEMGFDAWEIHYPATLAAIAERVSRRAPPWR